MNGAAKKIILVEDEPIAKSLYQNRLQSEGFDVSIAGDGEGALSELCKSQVDLVVLDLMMPRVNGEEALKQIRSDDRLKGMPVLVISNAYMTEMSQRAMDSGATRGLLKTECTPARLVETVRDLLGYRSAFDVSDSPVDDDKSIEEFANAAERALADEIKLKETREDFIKKSSSDIARIRETCRTYVKAAPGGGEAASESLSNLYQQVRFFATRAGLSGCVPIALVANAFEALLFDVRFKPSRATPSVSQTFAQAVDCLERLCQAKDGGVRDVIPRAKILVVDDDAVCNLAITAALKRAHFEPVATEDSTKVMAMAKSNQFDIVMLDINMPGMNGFELCKALRSMPQYKEIPVIFITANADFQNRAQSILSGGNDLIPKPVSPLELVLKVTMRLLQPQSAPADAGRAATPAVAVPNAPAPNADAAVAAPVASEKKAQQKGAKPNEEAPQLPSRVKQESSFSTEMLKKAWGGDRPGSETEKAKPASHDGVEHIPGQDTKIEVPRNETVADKKAEAKVSAEEKFKMEAMSIGPLKMAEEDKPKHVNGADKTDELLKAEAAKAEAAKAEAAKAEAAKAEAAKAEAAKAEAAKAEAAKAEAAKAEAAKAEAAKAEAAKAEAARAEAAKAEAAKAEAAKAEAAKAEAAKAEAAKAEAAKAEAAKAEAAKAEAAKAEAARAEAAKAEAAKAEAAKAEAAKAEAAKAEAAKAEAAKAAKLAAKAEKPISPNRKPQQHKDPNMENKKPTLDEAARGVARIIFGDENISDMNVRLTRIALEKYNVPGTQKLDDVARGVSQIIFGDDKVSEMNVRLTRIALERYNVADVLHLNGSNGTNGSHS